VRRAIEAWEMGATEVCIQAGLPPKLDGSYYIDLCRAIKAAVPEMHLHAFSPEEILYGSTRSGMPIPEYLTELKRAGLGTLPGPSAEILDQDIRDIIARGRITVDQWVESSRARTRRASVRPPPSCTATSSNPITGSAT